MSLQILQSEALTGADHMKKLKSETEILATTSLVAFPPCHVLPS